MEKHWTEKIQIEYKIDPEAEMWASVVLYKPEGVEEKELKPLTAVDLMGYLIVQGIVEGIDIAALEDIAAHTQFKQEFIVARGKPAVDGVDGHYEYLVPLEDRKSKPVVAPDGSVDYLNTLEISIVEEGQHFATYIPPTKGEDGFTVCGKELRAVPGKHIGVLVGKGFTTSEDGKEYFAKITGRIHKDNHRVVIDPIYVVNGDLDIAHGNIEFKGDVEVRGDVHSRLRIDAQGSIFIMGHVENCKIRAGGNITIGRGVQGQHNCELVAQGDIACNFVEYCNIISGGCVYANSLMNCRVFARDSVIVSSKLGCIIGGSINAMQSIRAKRLGNEAGLITKLSIGELPNFRKDLNTMKTKLAKLNEEVEIFEGQLEKYKRIGKANMTPNQEHLKMQVLRAKVVCQAEQKVLTAQIEALEDELRQARMRSYVRSSGVVFPGVVIMSDQVTFTQTEACKDVYYRSHLNKIEMMSPEDLSLFAENNTCIKNIYMVR